MLSATYVILTLVAFLTVRLVIITIKRRKFAKDHGCQKFTKTVGTALVIGNLQKVYKARKEGRLTEKLQESYDLYGVDTFEARSLGSLTVFTRHPENIKAMIATQFDDFDIGKRQQVFRPLLGFGIFAAEGQRWKHSRAMLRPQFAREQVAHVQLLEVHLQNFVKIIKEQNGNFFDIQHLFHRLTMDASTEFLFGESVGSLKSPNNEFEAAFNTSQHYLTVRATLRGAYFLVNPKEFKDANKVIFKTVRYYVDKALNTSPQELAKKTEEGYTFLYQLVNQTRDPQVLQDEMLSIMLAGRNTTASLLSFLFLELSRNKRIWKKLREEVHEHFGNGEGSRLQDITFESMKRCNYLKWVINETLRMYPSVPTNFRHASRDTMLPRGGGPTGDSPVFIKKNTDVFYTIYSTHRMKEYYGKDAEEFRPERWADLKNIGWAYMPFSSGPRICLGQQFALTEASYITIRLAQIFTELDTSDEVYPPLKIANTTMRPMNGVHVRFTTE